MQLVPPAPAGAIPLPMPHSAKVGAPIAQSVLLTASPSSNPFPGTGFGISGWSLPTAGLNDASAAAQRLSWESHTPMAVVEYRAAGVTRYSVAPLVRLRWEQQGYGGSFREHAAKVSADLLYAVQRSGSRRASVVLVADGYRVVPVQR